eukprot:3029356-Rhodomonas_salina.4
MSDYTSRGPRQQGTRGRCGGGAKEERAAPNLRARRAPNPYPRCTAPRSSSSCPGCPGPTG